jgi:peptidyl-dipeptidase Dcp
MFRVRLAMSLALATAAFAQNPLLDDWKTPFQLPPFDQIQPSHFMPAFREGMKQQLAEIVAITASSDAPTFANTIEAFEKTGDLLGRTGRVFFNLNSSHTNPQIQAVAREYAPLRAKHQNEIYLNPALFARVDAVYRQRAKLSLTPDQLRLLEKTHERFLRAGAQLDDAKKKRMSEIDQALASKTTQFAQNLLADTAAFELVLDSEADLAGLPDSYRAVAAETARQRGKAGKWVITLQRPSIEPFLQMSTRRDLREKAFRAFIARGDNENQFDNKALIRDTVLLRLERAQLLGSKTYADFALAETMAKTPANARGLMMKLWTPSVETALREAAELEKELRADRVTGPLEPWDWRFYAEKVRLKKFSLNEEQIKPYFPLDRMIEAAFWTANQLFGLTFTERTDLPKYHPDLRTWEVKDAKGNHVGIFYGDYYARTSKNSGAWMSSFRSQRRFPDTSAPVVINNLNYGKPPAGQPTLLSFDDANTLFHEFGHGLHGLLSNVRYESQSGTSVPRDFVELPSQIFEHWFREKVVLQKFAKHHQTGETIPAALLDKIRDARNFNQGFEMVEYLASAVIDLDWHSIDKPRVIDVREQEAEWLKQLGMPRQITMRHRSPHFAHIFSGGYAAGYYSYRWSAVLDNDGFEAFTEKGNPFDSEVARKLYTYIYSAGGTADPAELYQRFRGRDPNTDALMRSLGFQK